MSVGFVSQAWFGYVNCSAAYALDSRHYSDKERGTVWRNAMRLYAYESNA